MATHPLLIFMTLQARFLGIISVVYRIWLWASSQVVLTNVLGDRLARGELWGHRATIMSHEYNISLETSLIQWRGHRQYFKNCCIMGREMIRQSSNGGQGTLALRLLKDSGHIWPRPNQNAVWNIRNQSHPPKVCRAPFLVCVLS